MSSKLRRSTRSRSSIKLCEEKFSCQGEQAEACFQCEQCTSLQCKNCEVQIHKLSKYAYHDRRQVDPPPPGELCQNNCDARNYADFRCENCDLRYCHECFERMHSTGRRRQHKKAPLTIHLPSLEAADVETADQAASIASQLSDAIREQMQNLSLSSEEDQSLNFHSCSPVVMDSILKSPSRPRMETSDGSMNNVATIGVTSSDPKFKTSGTGPSIIHTEAGRPNSSNNDIDEEIYKDCKSFLLADQNETVKIPSEADFIAKLGCDEDSQVKVVSIFGNTGDGKSHTLNYTFFGGKEVFKTSALQSSCTVGVWAAFDPVHNAVIIDTEGLLGVSNNANQRTRLLLKVLAVSDVVIYRTRADRLHNDLFEFLGDASQAYSKHFTEELKAASMKTKIDQLSVLGPAVIVFHETLHTDTLNKDFTEPPENVLRRRFVEVERSIEAFSSLHYVGTRTTRPPTDFSSLLVAVKSQLRNSSVRSHRKPGIIYKALRVLNDKFSGDIEKSLMSTFPDQYFTCSARCLSCHIRCSQTMNHQEEEEDHRTDLHCKYQAQYDNRIYLCKECYTNGVERLVVPKTCSSREGSFLGLAMYAWAGYVLECASCGVIYRSRQYWYGNLDPINTVVRTEIRHVWPGRNPVLQGTHNAARRLVDGIQYVSDAIAYVGAKPTKVMANWMTDQIAPAYWIPNAQITHCYHCRHEFDHSAAMHHCRACGQGFCDECSLNKKPVPERGWGEEPVRVCDSCFQGDGDRNQDDLTVDPKDNNDLYPRKVGEALSFSIGAVANLMQYPLAIEGRLDAKQVQIRKYSESVGSTLTFVKSAFDYPMDVIRDTVRPAYWVPDAEISECCVCSTEFGPRLAIHHCRSCGLGVCDPCSSARRPVPSRGWDQAVRVCDACQKKKGAL